MSHTLFQTGVDETLRELTVDGHHIAVTKSPNGNLSVSVDGKGLATIAGRPYSEKSLETLGQWRPAYLSWLLSIATDPSHINYWDARDDLSNYIFFHIISPGFFIYRTCLPDPFRLSRRFHTTSTR